MQNADFLIRVREYESRLLLIAFFQNYSNRALPLAKNSKYRRLLLSKRSSWVSAIYELDKGRSPVFCKADKTTKFEGNLVK